MERALQPTKTLQNSASIRVPGNGSLKRFAKAVTLVACVRPFIWFFLGLNRYSRIDVPRTGPVIIAPNHNSHLDTVLLLGLLPLSVALRVSAAAAADYFYRIPILSKVLFGLFDMVPIWRTKGTEPDAPFPDPLEAMAAVLEQGRVLLIFPEGSRGIPEKAADLRRGIARLAQRFPQAPIIPVHLRGLGKSLPKGSAIFVPLIPQIAVGQAITGSDRGEQEILDDLQNAFQQLERSVSKKDWLPA